MSRKMLHAALNIPADERVIVTRLGGVPDHVDMEETKGVCNRHSPSGDPVVEMRSRVRYNAGDAGAELDGRVLDLALADGARVKWWVVEAMCRRDGLQTVPIYYDGPVSEVGYWMIRDAEAAGEEILLRCTDHGPWQSLRGCLDKVLLPGMPEHAGFPPEGEVASEYKPPTIMTLNEEPDK